MSLRVWLPLNGTLDNQGLDDVVVTNNGATVNNSGKIGKCYSFDGNDDYIQLTNFNMSNMSEFSISCWIKPTSSDLNSYLFLVRGNGSHQISLSGSFYFRDNHHSSQTMVSFGEPFLENIWMHISCVYKKGIIYLYQNGIQTQTANYYHEDSQTNSSNTEIRIGRQQSSSGNKYFTGCINDFRIYDHALSPMEVKQISQGLILHYPLNNNGFGQENLLAGTNRTFISSNEFNKTLDLAPIFDNYGLVPYTISFDLKSTDISNRNIIMVYCQNGSGARYSISQNFINNVTIDFKRYAVTVTPSLDKQNFVQSYLAFYGNYNTGNKPVVKNIKVELGQKATPWCLNETDELYNQLGLNNNIQYDTSGYNNNGVKTGTFQYDSDTPKYNVSTVFDNNYIKNLSFAYTSNTWSISLWYYFETMPSAYQGLICLSKGNGADVNKKMALMPNTNKIWFKVENKSGDIASLKIQQWTHIVLTCNGSDGKIYENGVLKKTVSGISSTYTDCDDLVIGARSAATDGTSISHFLDGKISDVRIYCTTLSEEDILSLYNNSAYIDNQGNIYGAIYEEV